MGIVGQVTRAVFLDRDGVMNRAVVREGRPYPPATLADLEIIPGAPAAARRLHEAGFLLIGMTNQPDVARGKTPRTTVEALNSTVAEAIGLDEMLTCFHDDQDDCDCRKPRPGQFFAMRDQRGVDLSQSFMVGDRWRDVAAAQNAGCRSVFIDYGYDEPFKAGPADFTCSSLAEAADWILSTSSSDFKQE